jgi:hypothetical protein
MQDAAPDAPKNEPAQPPAHDLAAEPPANDPAEPADREPTTIVRGAMLATVEIVVPRDIAAALTARDDLRAAQADPTTPAGVIAEKQALYDDADAALGLTHRRERIAERIAQEATKRSLDAGDLAHLSAQEQETAREIAATLTATAADGRAVAPVDQGRGSGRYDDLLAMIAHLEAQGVPQRDLARRALDELAMQDAVDEAEREQTAFREADRRRAAERAHDRATAAGAQIPHGNADRSPAGNTDRDASGGTESLDDLAEAEPIDPHDPETCPLCVAVADVADRVTAAAADQHAADLRTVDERERDYLGAPVEHLMRFEGTRSPGGGGSKGNRKKPTPAGAISPPSYDDGPPPRPALVSARVRPEVKDALLGGRIGTAGEILDAVVGVMLGRRLTLTQCLNLLQGHAAPAETPRLAIQPNPCKTCPQRHPPGVRCPMLAPSQPAAPPAESA